MKSHAPTAPRGGLDLVHAGVRAPEADVVGDRAAEQERLLRHDAHLRAQRPRRHLAQVVAVDEHAPVGRVVEARDELGEGRLARAGGADERHRLARRHDERQVVERELRAGGVVLRAVAEGDVLEADLAADALEGDGVGAVGELGRDVEQLEDLVERRHARLVGRVDLRELSDGVEEAVERSDEADEHADLDVAVDRLAAADHEDADGGDGRHELDGREVGRVEVDGDEVGVAVDVVELGEARAVARLLGEGPHDADARQRLLQVGGDGADRLACAPVGVGAGDPEGERPDRHHREDEEGQQRELGVEEEQDHHGSDERQRGLEERHDGVGDQRVERLDVVGHARDQQPGGAALVEADRHLLEVAEDLQAQVGQRALPDPADEVGLRVRRAPDDERADARTRPRRGRASRRSPCRMPESMAVLASGAGASDAAVPATSAASMSTTRVR